MWNGYASVRYLTNKKRTVHRIAYEIANCAVDESDGRKAILHSCDNRICCNPGHLLAGTYSDNTRDMFAKKRDHHSISYRLNGHSDPLYKLTMAQAEEVRAKYAAGGVTQNQLAAEYGLAPQNISMIVRGLSYMGTRKNRKAEAA